VPVFPLISVATLTDPLVDRNVSAPVVSTVPVLSVAPD
jgi:hypothetical protein